jgi:tripartite-type tricarboxylate transporter receptor subunit TctC
MKRVSILLLGAFAVLCDPIAGRTAGAYPDHAITLIVPFPPGGPNDVLARLVVDRMSRSLGQPVVIENVAGAGGTIGSNRGAKAAPDGYTMVSGNLGSHGASYSYYPQLGYAPDDFAGVGMVAGTPNFIAIRNSLPFDRLSDFVADARQNPDKYTAGHAGNGSNGHLVCLLFMKTAGIKMRLVPYRGSGPAMNDLLGGQIDAMCDSAPTVVPQAQGGTIKAMVVAQSERIDALKNVPTSAEAGIREFNVTGWNALFVPKGTPAPIIEKLNAALADALDDDNVKQRIADIGATLPAPDQRSPAALDTFVRSEIGKWGEVVKAAGASANP